MTESLPPSHLEAMARIAVELAEPGEARSAADRVVTFAISLTGATVAVLLESGPHEQVRLSATTDPVVADLLMAARASSGEGSNADGWTDQSPVVVDDLRDERRWPQFARSVTAQTALRSSLSIYLSLHSRYVGVLALFDERVGYFTPELQRLGVVFGQHAAIALAGTREFIRAENLTVALHASRLIGAASGVLMATHRISQDAAFDLLREASQRSNRRLRDIADDVVRTGTLPDVAASQSPASVR